MILSEIISTVKNELPEKAIDLSESLSLLREVINDTMASMAEKMSAVYLKKDFENTKKYMQLGECISEYENKINEVIDMLEFEEVHVNAECETDEKTESKNIPNYTEYIVDTRVEHTLYENFTHIRPHSFRLNNYYDEVKTWQEMLTKTCQYLMSLDKTKIHSFCENQKMNGKKNKYFTKNPDGLRNPSMIENGLFIETNMSGNGIRNLIIKILKEYGFKASDYKVYFKADYTEINK